MAMSTTPRLWNHAYCARSEIHFSLEDDSSLNVTIDTERLCMRSVNSSAADCMNYATLFGDPHVMSKFSTGLTKTQSEIEQRIQNVWEMRWRENDPYSGLAIFRNDTDDFIGHVCLGHSGDPGTSELAYLLHRAHWGKGYGSEAVMAVVSEYAPATIQEGYLLDGRVLSKIVATARIDNPASLRILEKVGMHRAYIEEKYGALRSHYSFDISWGAIAIDFAL